MDVPFATAKVKFEAKSSSHVSGTKDLSGKVNPPISNPL